MLYALNLGWLKSECLLGRLTDSCYRLLSLSWSVAWPEAERSVAVKRGSHFLIIFYNCVRYINFTYILVLMGIIITGSFTFHSIVHMPWWLLRGTFGWVCSAEQLRAQMPECVRAGCSMPTGWRVKLRTGAPSASHQNHDRWSSVQANFLLLWLCLLSTLISNAVMTSRAGEGKGKVWFFTFFLLVLYWAVGGTLKGHLVSFDAVKQCLNNSLLQLF